MSAEVARTGEGIAPPGLLIPVLAARGDDEGIGDKMELWVCFAAMGSLHKPR